MIATAYGAATAAGPAECVTGSSAAVPRLRTHRTGAIRGFAAGLSANPCACTAAVCCHKWQRGERLRMPCTYQCADEGAGITREPRACAAGVTE